MHACSLSMHAGSLDADDLTGYPQRRAHDVMHLRRMEGKGAVRWMA